MKNLYLLLVSIVLVVFYFMLPSSVNVVEEENIVEELIIFDLSLEEYIIGVVAAEMPSSFNVEALKAQAVASRTYALSVIYSGSELTTDVTTQAFITIDEMQEKWGEDFDLYYEKIKEAVYLTEGLVLKYEDEVITAFYFAISNGYTSDASLVFSESLDYIESVDSSWDKNVNNYEVTTKFSKTDFCNYLSISCDFIEISNIVYSDIGEVKSITVNEEDFDGTEFRTLLGLRSTTFEITISDEIYITTKGYGHGVGMSQYGANEMANEGYKYDEILMYYYKNVEILNI